MGPLPFGYQVDAESRVASEVSSEAAAATGAFECSAAGETNGQIADWFNGLGFKSRTGRMFTTYSLKDMLRCPFYVGVVQHKGNEYSGRHAGILEAELYERVQQRRRGERQPQRQRSGSLSVLHGKLHRGNYDRSLHSDRNHYGYPMYGERHGWPCDANGRSIVAQRVNEQISEIISSVELRPDWRDRMAD